MQSIIIAYLGLNKGASVLAGYGAYRSDVHSVSVSSGMVFAVLVFGLWISMSILKDM